MPSLSRTPLYETHQALGARLVEFGGWEMPVQYSSILDEHLAVRRASGLFDISHMGEIFFVGEDAVSFVNLALTNDARSLGVGEGQYSLLCQDDGGVVDDLYVFRVSESEFLWVVNASRIAAVIAWLDQLQGRVQYADLRIENRSNEMSGVAVQGPRVKDFIGEVIAGASRAGLPVASVLQLQKNQIGEFEFQGNPVWVSRTGYTGEDGFECLSGNTTIIDLWGQLLAQGHQACLQPCGLGARDTLRTEMGYPLYGHELSDSITPLEAGLGFFVKLSKAEFVGREALLQQKSEGVSRRSLAFRMVGKAPPPRPDYPVWIGPDQIGVTTSGSVSPCLKTGIGLAMVDVATPRVDAPIEIEIRGRRYPAVTVKKPIYSKN